MTNPLPTKLATTHGNITDETGLTRAICSSWSEEVLVELVARYNAHHQLIADLAASQRQAELYRQETHRWAEAVRTQGFCEHYEHQNHQ